MSFTYNIPEVFIPGFLAIKELSFEDTERVSEFLKNIPKGVSASQFQDTFLSLPIPNAAEIGKTILSFGSLLTKNPVDDISERLVASYERAVKKTLNNNEKDEFSKKLFIILSNSDNIKYTYKAIDLLTENDKVYLESRILTDIRTVFDAHTELSISDAVIFHQLRIEYLNNGEHFKSFFALDLSDLKELRASIDRAIEKQNVITEKYKSVTNFIEIEE